MDNSNIHLGNQSSKSSGSLEIFYIYIFCGCTIQLAFRILVPWLGIAPMSSVVETWSSNHWITREFPGICYILKLPWITNLLMALLLQQYSSPCFQSWALDSYGSFNPHCFLGAFGDSLCPLPSLKSNATCSEFCLSLLVLNS